MEITKVQVPSSSPMCCRRCSGLADRQWFLDLGYIEEFWGAVYYCDICFREMAEPANYMTVARHDARMEKLQDEYATLLKENDVYASVLGYLSFASVDFMDLFNYVCDKKGIRPPVVDPSTGADKVGDGTSRPPKQANVKRPVDLPDLTIEFNS